MGKLRAAFRLVVALLATSILYALFLTIRAVLPLRPRVRWRNFMVRIWAVSLSRIIGMRVSVTGPRPEGRFVLVSNHLSYVDILLLAQAADVVFISKSEVRHWPFIGRLAASVGTIFADRESRRDTLRVVAEMENTVRLGIGVLFFPEGMSSDGTAVLPFKPALLDVPSRSELPVYHAAIRYRTPTSSPPAESTVAWFGDAAFAPHVWKMLQLPRFDASLLLGGSMISRDRKQLAQQLWHEVNDKLRTLQSA